MNATTAPRRTGAMPARESPGSPGLRPARETRYQKHVCATSSGCRGLCSSLGESRQSSAPTRRSGCVPESLSLRSRSPSHAPVRSAKRSGRLRAQARRRGHVATAETHQQAARPVWATDSGRTATSCVNRKLRALAVGRVSETSLDVLRSQVGQVFEDLLLRHSGRKVLEHVIYRDTQTTNARLATALARLDRDDVSIVHGAVPSGSGYRPRFHCIEQPTTFEFVINTKTAAALGTTMPQRGVRRAEEVME